MRKPERYPLALRIAGALLALIAIGSLGGCTPTSLPVLLEPARIPADQAAQWEKYGAFYVFDEIFVEESFHDGPVGNIIAHKRVKILTREGVKHGSIEVPRFSSFIRESHLTAIDSAGRPMKLDTSAMMAEYRKNGKLLFPNVTAGCELEVYLHFSRNDAITVFENWFSKDIPVARGRFIFSNLNNMGFEFAEYGHVRQATARMQKPVAELNYHAWEITDILPRGRLEYQEEVDVDEPRVSVVMRSFNQFPVISDWEGLGKKYQDVAFKTSFFNSTRKLNAKADEICKGKSSPEEKAQALFQWVEDNISFKASGLESINPDRVIESGQGNLWETAVVLKEMFNHAGLKTEVMVTRPRSMGGFDPKFETPLQLIVPLVSVHAGGKDLLAYPYSRAGALGEFPDDLFNLSALSITFKDTTHLPEYAGGPSYERSTYRIDLSDPDADQKLDMELGGYQAYAVRMALFKESKTEVKEVFQKVLTRFGTSNALTGCQIVDQNARGKPLTAKLAFRNPNQVVERKGEMQMRLSHLFHPYFASYDTSRSAGFRHTLDDKEIVRLEVAKVPGKALEAILPCSEMDNALFKVTCATQDGPDTYVFTRELLLRKAKLSAAEMRALYPQIVELNRLGEGRLVVRGEAVAKDAAKPAAAKAKRD